MTHIEVGGRSYSITRGSDVVRDGMFLEAGASDTGEAIAEVFYSDRTHEMSFSAFREGLPVELVEQLLAAARRLLPVSPDTSR